MSIDANGWFFILGTRKSFKSIVQKARFTNFIIAAGIYAGFAVYLFWPHLENFNRLQYLLSINVCLGCLGCYLLSRRWVGAFAGSLFAGAVYGFGPYMLGLLKFHPAATLLAAAIPWLFCPAAFIYKRERLAAVRPRRNGHWLSVLLSTLPFVIIILFFRVATHLRLFPIPTQAQVHLSDLAGLLAPLVMVSRSITLVGFYHVPIAALIMGFLMLLAPLEILRTGNIWRKRRFLMRLAARRYGIFIIFALGTVLAICAPNLKSLANVSPIIWLTIPVLCCSVLIGEGMQGLALAGDADRKWVLVIIASMGVLVIVTLLLATIPDFRFSILDLRFMGHDLQLSIGNQQTHLEKLFLQTAKLYILGAVATAIIFFIARAKKRLLLLRWIVLCSAMTVDIFLSARFIVDRIL